MSFKTPTRHFVTMDGLRGVAAVTVAIYHRRFWLGPQFISWHGSLAVDFFFLLSGFVIAHAYGSRLASRSMGVRGFLETRCIRLYPMIVLGALLGTAAVVLEGVQAHWLGQVARGIAALPFAMLALPQPFLPEPFLPNGPVWSLFFEIIANVAYVAFMPWLATRWLAALAAALGAALAWAIVAHSTVGFGWLWPTMPLGLLRVGFPFTLGVLFQRLHESGRLRVPALPVWMLGTLLIAILCFPNLAPFGETVYTLLVLYLIFPLMVASASHDEPSSNWTRFSKLSATTSYPIYLLHWGLFGIIDRVPGFGRLPTLARFAVVIPLAIGLSLAVAWKLDEPIRNRITAKLAARRNARYQSVALAAPE